MKLFFFAVVVSALSIGFTYSTELDVATLAKKLREKEIIKWDDKRFYGQLKDKKVGKAKNGIYRIFAFFEKQASSR